jgi:DNA-binding transcriptional LysR family regulator
VQALGSATNLLLDGIAAIGLLQSQFADIAILRSFHMLTVSLIPVVAADHPLAAVDGLIDTHILQRYVQLVLTDRSTMTAGRDYGVLSSQTWRLADIGAKHSMLRDGIGWGNMPAHLVEEDIERGRLKRIHPAEFDARVSRLAMGGAYRADQKLGPAGQWMVDHLSKLGTP